MFIDGRRIASGAVLDTDVAIVGGGAAGITIARRLAGARRNVCLIESGGFEPDDDVQSLYEGSTSGVTYPALDSMRARYLGGTTNMWGGWCRPLDGVDFERREWLPHSGWPISRAALEPYYRRARAICELGSTLYDGVAPASLGLDGGGAILENDLVRAAFFQFSPPTRFGERYRRDLAKAATLRCLLNTNVVDFEMSDDGSAVTGLVLACLQGPRFTVRARTVVLAAGGIENARLLMQPTPKRSRGLGNTDDMAGRFFMDHPVVGAGRLLIRAEGLAAVYGDRSKYKDAELLGCIAPTARFLRAQRSLNFLATVGPLARHRTSNAEDKEIDDGGVATGRPAPAAPPPRIGLQAFDVMRRTLPSVQPIGPELIEYAIGINVEVMPDPDNRLTLTADRDALGLQRVHLHWRPHVFEKRSMLAGLQAIGRSLLQQRLGRMYLRVPETSEWLGDTFWGRHHYGNHHSGTTRMSTSPLTGVVDRNCRVHDVRNLYVAGSSVFSTIGAAHPTLTVVALAVRLADHLAENAGGDAS